MVNRERARERPKERAQERERERARVKSGQQRQRIAAEQKGNRLEIWELLSESQDQILVPTILQGYLTHKKTHPPGTLPRRPVPRVLGGSLGGASFLMGEVPLYLCLPRSTANRAPVYRGASPIRKRPGYVGVNNGGYVGVNKGVELLVTGVPRS